MVMCEPQVGDGAQTTFPSSRTPVALDFSTTLSSSSFLRLLSVGILCSSKINLFVLSGNSDTSAGATTAATFIPAVPGLDTTELRYFLFNLTLESFAFMELMGTSK